MGDGYDSKANSPVGLAMVSVISVALYNVIELNVIIFSMFKRKSGLYFWSFLAATWGIFFHTISYLLWNFGILKSDVAWLTIAVMGWVPMVTGQSLVLYSRLHLILYDERILNLVLGMIILNVVIGHIPTIVVAYGTVLAAEPGPYVTAYSIYKKVQVSLFFAQEVIISSLYILYTYQALRMQEALHGAQASKMLYHLLSVNAIVIILDTIVVVLEYKNLYDLQTATKGMVYSIKLKIEYSILTSLINLAQSNVGHSGENHTVPYFDSQERGTGETSSGSHGSRTLNYQNSTINSDKSGVTLRMNSTRGESQNGPTFTSTETTPKTLREGSFCRLSSTSKPPYGPTVSPKGPTYDQSV